MFSALESAVEDGLIARNPAKKSNRPKLPTAEHTTLSAKQLQAFCKAVRQHELGAVFILAALTGMRQGECLGLMWDDINFDRGTISIKRTLTQLSRKNMITQSPKTEKSERTIRPHGMAMEALWQHRETMEKNRPESAWVFVWKDGGPVPRRNLLRIHKKLLEAAECPEMTFHELRHSAGTLLMELGENPKIVQELLGHSNISTTLGLYSHASESMTGLAASKLGALAIPEPSVDVA